MKLNEIHGVIIIPFIFFKFKIRYRYFYNFLILITYYKIIIKLILLIWLSLNFFVNIFYFELVVEMFVDKEKCRRLENLKNI